MATPSLSRRQPVHDAVAGAAAIEPERASRLAIARSWIEDHERTLWLATALPAIAADYPAPRHGEWIAKDFKFHTGETLPELKLHYTTVGEPTGQPVLLSSRAAPSRCRVALFTSPTNTVWSPWAT